MSERSCLKDLPMLALKDHCISQGKRLPSQESNFLARPKTGPSCFPTMSLMGEGRREREGRVQGTVQVRAARPAQPLTLYKGRAGDQNRLGKHSTAAAFDKQLWAALQSPSPGAALPSGLPPSHSVWHSARSHLSSKKIKAQSLLGGNTTQGP